MEQSDAIARTPFSSLPGHQVQPLAGSEARSPKSSPDPRHVESMSLPSAMDTQISNTPAPQSSSSLVGSTTAQQPKVQTAFIHKLYNMLEDANIQHLISWSQSNESFVVSPTGEFSKVLSQYFKHTNISSFVRQLNMYGFHKVNDVFHTGSPDSTLWEFKHGNGSFKRGDLVGLREIKRRASRQTLIHRDSFSGTKSTSTPGTPSEQPNDSVEARLIHIEQTLFEVNGRLARAEESNSYLVNRCQSAAEGLSRCQQWVSDITQILLTTFPPDSPVFRELQSVQKEIERHTQATEESPGDILRDRNTYGPGIDNAAPLSPRQKPPLDDGLSRRSSYGGPARHGYFRPPAPPHVGNPPRRVGSVSVTGSSSPNTLKPQQAAQPPAQHLLAGSQSPHLPRRHTSADIRQVGWQPNSPFSGIGQTPHWPPSPNRALNEFKEPCYDNTQHPRPPLTFTSPPLDNSEPQWNIPKFSAGGAGNTAPPTRRSSLASSSVHALLNPPNVAADREGTSDGEVDDARKRKRLS